MNHISVTVIKILITLLLAALVALQCCIVWLALASPLSLFPTSGMLVCNAALPAVLSIAFTACVQIVLVCVWKLVQLAQVGEIFRNTAFTWVNVALRSVLTATGIVVCTVLMCLFSSHALYNFFALPGAVIALFGLGLALIITVMRSLLQQATQLEAELSEVI